MDFEPEYFGDRLFFDLVDMPAYRGGSLEIVSGQVARRSGFETPMIEGLETAWRTPFSELKCQQVTELLIQKMGLEWLARPILNFVTLYPEADTGYYPGDMIANMLAAAEDFHVHAASEFGAWLQVDDGWLDDLFGFSRISRRKVAENLARARAALPRTRP